MRDSTSFRYNKPHRQSSSSAKMKRNREEESLEHVEFIFVEKGDVSFSYVNTERMHPAILQMIASHNLLLNANKSFDKTVMLLYGLLQDKVVNDLQQLKMKNGAKHKILGNPEISESFDAHFVDDEFLSVVKNIELLDDTASGYNNEKFELVLKQIIEAHVDSKDEKWFAEMFGEAMNKYGSLKDTWRDAWREKGTNAPYELVTKWALEIYEPFIHLVEMKMKKRKYDFPVYPRTYGSIKVITSIDNA